MTRLLALSLALALGLLAAPATAQDAPGNSEAGADLFADYCAACHGMAAAGDGPLADLLTVAPADLTLLAERFGGTFPVFHVAQRIDGRDPLLAHGGEMPVFGPLFQGREVAIRADSGQPILTSRAAVDLIAWLATQQK